MKRAIKLLVLTLLTFVLALSAGLIACNNGPAKSITLDKTQVTLTIFDNPVTITATTENITESVTWTSSNAQVATVSNGVITARSEGSATITATAEGVSATCQVTVAEYSGTIKAMSDLMSFELNVGGTKNLSASVYASIDEVNVLEGATFTYESQNQAIATVSASGLVTAVASGQTTITVGGSYEGYSLTPISIPVTVKEKVELSLNVPSDLLYLSASKGLNNDYVTQATFAPTVTIDGEPVLNADIAVENLNPEIVSYEDGVISAVSVGAATLKVSYTSPNGTYVEKNLAVTVSIPTTTLTEDGETVTIGAKMENDLTEFGINKQIIKVDVSGAEVEFTFTDGKLIFNGDIEVGMQEVKLYAADELFLINAEVVTKIILTADDWNTMEANGYYILDRNLDFAGQTITANRFNVWGDNGVGMCSLTLDGRGYSISNMTITNRLFTWLANGATIKNIGFINVDKVGWHSFLCDSAITAGAVLENVFLHVNFRNVEPSGSTGAIANEGSAFSLYNCVIVANYDITPTGGSLFTSGTPKAMENVYLISTNSNGKMLADGSTDGLYTSFASFGADASEIIKDFDEELWTIENGLLVLTKSVDTINALYPTYTSLEITTAETELLGGSFVTLATNASYSVTYSLKAPVDGVSIEGNKLVAGAISTGAVTVVATFVHPIYGTILTSEKQFTLCPTETVTKTTELYEISSTPFSYNLSEYGFDSLISVTFDNEIVENTYASGILSIDKTQLTRKLANVVVNARKSGVVYSIIIPLEVADIIIRTADDWTRFGRAIGGKEDSAQFSGKRAILADDIDYQGKDWTTEIGVNYGRFLIGGELDGRGYSVSNIKSYDAKNYWDQSIGLFSHINNATLKNIAFLNVDIKSSTGALARNTDNDTKVENVLITGNYEMGNVGDFVGGLFYSAGAETSKNIVSLLNITSSNATGNTCAISGYGGQKYENVYTLKVNGNAYANMFDTPASFNVNYQMNANFYNDLTAFNADVANVVATLNNATTSVEWYVDNGTIAMKPIV